LAAAQGAASAARGNIGPGPRQDRLIARINKGYNPETGTNRRAERFFGRGGSFSFSG